MIEVYEALAAYQRSIAKSRLDAWPDVWTGYWSSDGYLGDLGWTVDPGGEAEGVYWGFVPFAFSSQVITAYAIFEGHKATGPYLPFLESDPVLYATRLFFEGTGVLATHWIVPYRIVEGGVRLYDAPYKSPFFVPKLFDTLGMLMDRRNTSALYTFEEAVAAAVRGDDGFTDV